MFPIPPFIWIKAQTNLGYRSDDDAEEKRAALLASSVSSFSKHLILWQRSRWSSEMQLLEKSLIQSTREPKGIFSFTMQSLECLLSSTGVSNFNKFISKGNPLTLQPWSKRTLIVLAGGVVTAGLQRGLVEKSGNGFSRPKIWPGFK